METRQNRALEKTKCLRCGSTQTYVRKRDNKRVCVKCGHEVSL